MDVALVQSRMNVHSAEATSIAGLAGRDRVGKGRSLGRVLQWACLALGFGLLLVMLFRMEPAQVLERLEQSGTAFFVVLGVHLVSVVFMALGWRFAMITDKRLPFGEVLRAYWSGHAINGLTPVRSLGDVLAGSILRGRKLLGGEEGVASLVALNFVAALATVGFLLLGPLVCLATGFRTEVNRSLLFWSAVSLAPMVGFYLLLRLGLAARIVRLVGRIPALRPADLESWVARGETVDKQVSVFLNRAPARFTLSLLCWTAVRVLQALEVWILMLVLLPDQGASASLLLAISVQTGGLLVCGLLSFVPGQIGVAEGGSAFLFGWLGLAPVAGFSMELIRRVCKLVGIAVGLVLGWLSIGHKSGAVGSRP